MKTTVLLCVLAMLTLNANAADPFASQPFQQESAGACSGGVCTMKFSTVPIGKRLVVTFVSAAANVPDLVTPTFLLTDGVTFHRFTSVGDRGAYTMSSPTSFVVDQGKIPIVYATYGSGAIQYGAAALTGYFVNIR